MAIQNATTPDAQIAAVENLLTKFADTEFKGMALQMAVQAAQQAGDMEKMTVYAERTLKEDPKNFMVMMMLSQSIAQKTREFDLDKEEKLKQAEKYANDGLEALKTAVKPRPAACTLFTNQSVYEYAFAAFSSGSALNFCL